MAMQVLGQSGGSSLFSGNTNLNMTLSNDMYDFSELSKAELAAPQLIMLANVALTGEVSGNCCEYMVDEERQMAELTTVGNANFSDSDGEGAEDAHAAERDHEDLGDIEVRTLGSPDVRSLETEEATESSRSLKCSLDKDFPMAGSPEDFQLSGDPDDFQLSDAPQGFRLSGDPEDFDFSEIPEGFQLSNSSESVDDRGKSLKNKPFRCKPCQYEAESEQEFVHHIRVHSAKRFIVEEKAEKHGEVDSSSTTDEVDFSKGPIRCDRCGYNTNRYDHYLAHLKHHNKAGENEKVYKCTICTYTTISEYHWKKHLRNHFPRKVYTCLQCSYFSDRKNNYVQHIRTHTGERPYRCTMCPYSSSQKTHLTRHMRTHSGEKPFKCEQCSYVASNQHEVTRHARQVHDGPKPLVCPHCEYKTADRSNFKKHVELHVSPRQFLCPVCEYAASKKCNLQYHIKSRHPDCCDITMDVSKVRLRTKKNEVNISENVEHKVEEDQAKKELAEKKNERATKEEKKESLSKEEKKENMSKEEKKFNQPKNEKRENLPKEKKLVLEKVTTRSRKTLSKNKDEDMKTEKMAEKTGKTKKLKRTAENNSLPEDIVTDVDDIIAKKKKKTEKSQKCQESQNNDNKLEDAKKEESCLKKNKRKKELKNKSVNNNSKPACENIVGEDALPIEPLEEERKKSNDSCNRQQPVIPSDVGENMQDLESPSVQSVDKNVEVEMEDQEMTMAEEDTSQTASENEIGIELTVTPRISALNLNATLEKETAMLEDTLLNVAKNIQTTQMCEMEVVTNPAVVQETQPMETDEGETVSSPHPEHDSSTEELQAEDPAGGASTSQLPEKNQQSTKTGLVSAAPGGTVVNESQEMEEDEGIHSHDGSDISDNISEGSDDSGLNGARTAQEKTSQKAPEEHAEVKVTKENYVCIFCDRSFKKESEYSKHLNRHLVNVYYLEKATKGQG
nr:RE1-silencing transcription factor [Anolis sagrei ordinatus]XP_060618673.1 RE1-silencing transcription factor [Anolis sagrei ordinatus]XP_060618675.1 RE1-silencing transcription factor [Anolis sagrei ordinatus]XP_060618676.1 RE1-silencing transcription factor [Anolis sagrei ordinatus]